MNELQGTGVALCTPFKEDLSIDYPALGNLIDHIGAKLDFLVVCGTTGETPTLSNDEKYELLDFVLENNPNKLPIVFGLSWNNTIALGKQIKSFARKGVAALLTSVPSYNKPSQEGIYQHYKHAADSTHLPIMMYNVPGRTCTNMSHETTLRLAEHPNILSVKEASGNLDQCLKIAKDMPEGFGLLSGDDLKTLPILSIGGNGLVSVLANAYPAEVAEVVRLGMKGDYAAAAAAQYKLVNLVDLIFAEGNPAGIKAILNELGVCSAKLRLPMTPVSESTLSRIKKELL